MNEIDYSKTALGQSTATGIQPTFGDNDTLLRQHCLELAIKRLDQKDKANIKYSKGSVETAQGFYDLIKGAGKDPTPDAAPPPETEGKWHYPWGEGSAEPSRRIVQEEEVWRAESNVDAMKPPTIRPNSFEASVEPASRPRCTNKVVFRRIMDGENLGEYMALRDRYDLDEVNYNGFPLDSTLGK